MNACVFCKILNGDLSASLIYRGRQVSAFLDIHPINSGHVLVVPNEHFERFSEVPKSVAGALFETAQVILTAIQNSSLRCEGANLFLSDGKVAGQEVLHTHLHIAPRFKGDGHHVRFSHGDPELNSRSELDRIAKEITDKLNS